jgi:hypothetical protein
MTKLGEIRTICSKALVDEFFKAQPLNWKLKHWIIHSLLFSSLNIVINELDAIMIAVILTSVWILLVRFVFRTSDILRKPVLRLLMMTYLIILWGIVNVLGHIHDEYNDMILAAIFFKAIISSTICISINTLSDSNILLLDVGPYLLGHA